MRKIALFVLLFNILSISNIYSQNNNLKYDADKQGLFNALKDGKTDIAVNIIKLGTDVNIKDEYGWSLLHRAVEYNNTAVVKELLESKKIDIEAKLPENTIITNDNEKWYADGETPLLLACYYGYGEIVKMLLNYGANLEARDSIDSAMAIHIAASRGYSDIIEIIMQSYSAKKINNLVDIEDDTGTTPLMWASMNNQIPAINILLKYGANINAQDYDGWSALHFAAASQSYKAVEILLKNKANANLENVNNDKAIDLSSDTDIVELLNKYTNR
ncbi:ankyrin repeat domain-containing protein [Brachyspira pilosicoli]|uniref:ankyrin repeat domain-containing protein n=1 Tax=Brachyspira pilosicoli TaxID=52584 RepID=UPI0030066A32